MPFSEPPPPEPPELVQEPPAPPWAGPPDTVLGTALDSQLVLARTDSAAVLVRNLVAYPTGLELVLEIRRRRADLDLGGSLARRPRAAEIGAEVLRFGVELADGSKATNLDARPVHSDGETRGPSLLPRSGSGGPRRWDNRYWLWPLPPPGPLAFVVEWPSEGIGETRVEIDTAGIREAASRAVTLWDEDDRASGGAFQAFGPVER